jgi:ubiquinone/menaquinone biosynthesis C-methylase UbiE
MQKTDYTKMAAAYDNGRWLSEQNMDMWLGIIDRYSKAQTGASLLDLGCGTGRFSIPIAEKLGYKVTGADASPEMLGKAVQKDTLKLVTWNVQDAHKLTYPDRSFDAVLMSHVLHHCENPEKVVSECYRVLKPDGVFLLRHCVIEEIRQDPESVFFPEDLAINEARIAPLKTIKALLKKAGFKNIKSEMIKQRSSENSKILYERLANRTISGLAMIPQEAFERGLKRLYEYILQHPDDPWLLDEKLRITTGYKTGSDIYTRYRL